MADGVSLPPSSGDAAAAVTAAQAAEIPLGKAEITELPPEIENLPVAQKLTGEVTSVNKDGTVTIQTAKGDIILVPQTPVADGTKVTVNIPPQTSEGDTVRISLSAVSGPATGSAPVLPQMPVPEDTVSFASDTVRNINLQKYIETAGLGRAVKTVMYPSPIIMTDEGITGVPQEQDIQEQYSKPHNSVRTAVEILQQTEADIVPLPAISAESKYVFSALNSVTKTQDELIRNLMGLSAKNDYPGFEPYKPVIQNLPLIAKTVADIPQQTSNLAFYTLPDVKGNPFAGKLELPSLKDLIAEFRQSGVNATNIASSVQNILPQQVSAKIIMIQIPGLQMPDSDGNTAMMPLKIFNAGILQIPEINVTAKNLITSGLPDIASAVSPYKDNILLPAVSLGTVGISKQQYPVTGQPNMSVTVPDASQNIKATLWVTPSGFTVIPDAGEEMIIPGTSAIISVTSETIVSVKHPLQITDFVPTQSSVTGVTNALSAPDMILGEDWPSLQQSVEALAEISAGAARALISNIPMPTVPPQFTPAVIFFMAALRIGDVRAWTGDKVIDALERAGKSDLAKRLGSDFSTTSARSKEPLNDGWRPFPIPIIYDEHLSRMQLFVRRDGDEENDKKKGGSGEKKTRFLIDLVLTRTGEIQIDGLVRGKQMDMIVRTKNRLPDEMQQNIRKRFMHAAEMTGMNGSIHLYGKGEGWVKVERPQGAPGVRV